MIPNRWDNEPLNDAIDALAEELYQQGEITDAETYGAFVEEAADAVTGEDYVTELAVEVYEAPTLADASQLYQP